MEQATAFANFPNAAGLVAEWVCLSPGCRPVNHCRPPVDHLSTTCRVDRSKALSTLSTTVDHCLPETRRAHVSTLSTLSTTVELSSCRAPTLVHRHAHTCHVYVSASAQAMYEQCTSSKGLHGQVADGEVVGIQGGKRRRSDGGTSGGRSCRCDAGERDGRRRRLNGYSV